MQSAEIAFVVAATIATSVDDRLSSGADEDGDAHSKLADGAGSTPLRAGAYGERTCQCRGVLLEMQGGKGWIQPLHTIDHPAIKWNRGHVYLSKHDIRHQEKALRPGDAVAFYLYVDNKGLGAEDCRALRDPSNVINPSSLSAMVAEAPSSSWGNAKKSWGWDSTSKWSSWEDSRTRWDASWSKDGHDDWEARWPSSRTSQHVPERWSVEPTCVQQKRFQVPISLCSTIVPDAAFASPNACDAEFSRPSDKSTSGTASTCSGDDNDDHVSAPSDETSPPDCHEDLPDKVAADASGEEEALKQARNLALAVAEAEANCQTPVSLPPPPGLPSPPPVMAFRPPPGLAPPAVLAVTPNQPAAKTTLSLVDMLI